MQLGRLKKSEECSPTVRYHDHEPSKRGFHVAQLTSLESKESAPVTRLGKQDYRQEQVIKISQDAGGSSVDHSSSSQHSSRLVSPLLHWPRALGPTDNEEDRLCTVQGSDEEEKI